LRKILGLLLLLLLAPALLSVATPLLLLPLAPGLQQIVLVALF
jgi:hypothetical protein